MSRSSWDATLVGKVRSLAGRVVAGDLFIFEGCRELATVGYRLEAEDDPLFSDFIAIESETEGYPLGAERALWSDEALRRKDAELLKYEPRVRDTIIEACQRLLARLSSES